MITCIVCTVVTMVITIGVAVFLIKDIKREENRILSFDEWDGE